MDATVLQVQNLRAHKLNSEICRGLFVVLFHFTDTIIMLIQEEDASFGEHRES
jgi:hypothetical protein